MTAPDPTFVLRLNSIPALPTPTNYSVSEAIVDGQRWIAIKIDVQGASIVGWFDPDGARALAVKLRAIASGLQIAGDPTNNGNGESDVGNRTD